MTTNNNQVANNNIELTTEEILNILADSHYLYSDDEASDEADLSATEYWNQYINDDDNEEFYDNRYWDGVNGVYTNRKMYDKDDVLLPNLNENYFAEQDEIKIKFPINDNNLHN